MTNLINPWKIIKDKGIGKVVGKIKTDLGDYSVYEKRIIIICSSILDKYGTILSQDIYSLKNNKFVEIEHPDTSIIYFGKNKDKAIEYFNKIVEKDKKEKQNLIDKIFSKN